MPSMSELPSGVRAQVRSHFDGGWASGFRVFSPQLSDGYLVRRVSDRAVVPIIFVETELRLDPMRLPTRARSTWLPPSVA